MMKINYFRGDLINISAKTEPLLPTSFFVFNQSVRSRWRVLLYIVPINIYRIKVSHSITFNFEKNNTAAHTYHVDKYISQMTVHISAKTASLPCTLALTQYLQGVVIHTGASTCHDQACDRAA